MSEEWEDHGDMWVRKSDNLAIHKDNLLEIYYNLVGVEFDLSAGHTDVDDTIRYCMKKLGEEKDEKNKKQKAAGQLYQVLGALLADADNADPEKARLALDLMLWLAGEVDEPDWDDDLLPWSN